MSYKEQLQGNNIDLQGLLEMVDTLPEAEKLEDELSTQDNLIEQILTELDNKSSTPLPELTNPAGPEHILSGFEAVDGDGVLIEGMLEIGKNITFEEVFYSTERYVGNVEVDKNENYLIFTTLSSDTYHEARLYLLSQGVFITLYSLANSSWSSCTYNNGILTFKEDGYFNNHRVKIDKIILS